jgi:hypothetical protein
MAALFEEEPKRVAANRGLLAPPPVTQPPPMKATTFREVRGALT